MTAPTKDPSAMGLIDGAIKAGLGDHSPRGVADLLEHIDAGYELAHRHSLNVDKQRRRLLAEVCERRAWAILESDRYIFAETDSPLELRLDARHEKLRTWAERLRGGR